MKILLVVFAFAAALAFGGTTYTFPAEDGDLADLATWQKPILDFASSGMAFSSVRATDGSALLVGHFAGRRADGERARYLAGQPLRGRRTRRGDP